MNRWGTVVCVVATVLVAGCAGSATHAVVSPYQANDANLTYEQIQIEMTKAQFVVDGVNKDKEDWTAADITDGLLWFPFNLIAKDSNYREALEACNMRIARLTNLRNDKGCTTATSVTVPLGTSKANIIQPTGTVEERLIKLKLLVDQGLLSEEEAAVKRKEILGGL